MKYYRCDYCEDEHCRPDPPIILKGYGGDSGILLPHIYQEKHFCHPDCYHKWTMKNMPDRFKK